jgi:hypothetical protein
VIAVRAGTTGGTSAAPLGYGAKIQGATVNIGSAATPGSNPTQLIIEGGTNTVGFSITDPSDPAIQDRQANAVVRSTGDMNVYLRGAPLTTAAGVPFDDNYALIIRGGTASASNSGASPLFVTALGALQADRLTMETQGSILFQGGTANLQTANALAAANALLLVRTDKTITTRNGGSVVLIGGTANVSNTDVLTGSALTSVSARNSQAMAQMDPSKLTLTVDGILVLQGGKTTGPQGALASARIDAGDEIKINVLGSAPYTYTNSGGVPTALGIGSFFLVGGPDSGFFDANHVDLGGTTVPQAFPITVTLAGAFRRGADSGLAGGIVQTGLVTFDDSLLSYVIFAANEETRAARIRKGVDNDDIGLPDCK